MTKTIISKFTSSLFLLLNTQYATITNCSTMAFNSHNQPHKRTQTITRMNANIKIQSEPDDCLNQITTIEGIRSKIDDVRALQNTYRDATLYHRDWKSTNIDGDDDDDDSGNQSCSLKVLQFNTLAQGLSSGPSLPTPFKKSKDENSLKSIYGGFTDIPNPEIALDFDLRRWRLMEVLLEDDFDLIALEEVDRFHGFFEPLMNIIGHEGVYMPKPHSPCVPSGFYSDGCAFFWKKEKVEMLKVEKREYEVGSQVYIIATMRHLESERIFVVAVTHLKAGKGVRNEIIRAEQVDELLPAIEKNTEEAKKMENASQDIPVIIAGDFNSDPSETNSCIHRVIPDGTTTKLTGIFKSAYEIKSPPDPSLYTSWKSRGNTTTKRLIDYIFYKESKGSLICNQILEIPSKLEETFLPGFKYPSDHIAIGAKFLLEKLHSVVIKK